MMSEASVSDANKNQKRLKKYFKKQIKFLGEPSSFAVKNKEPPSYFVERKAFVERKEPLKEIRKNRDTFSIFVIKEKEPFKE